MKKETIVFIHGFGEDRTIWNNQIEFFKDKFQLIVPDLPGSGKATMDDGPWTMDRFADIIKEILDAESISKCTMIGHSMGGYISLAFAEKYPQYLNRFGLFHSTSFADSEEKIATRKKAIDFMKQHGAYEFLKTSIPNLFSEHTKNNHPEIIDELLNKAKAFSADALIAYYEAMIKRPDRRELLPELKIPVLFIAGAHDAAIPLDDVLKQCHLPERSFFHILQNSGHQGMIEEADRSNAILSDFCSP